MGRRRLEGAPGARRRGLAGLLANEPGDNRGRRRSTRNGPLLALCSAILLALAQPAAASTTLTPVADSYVDAGAPGKNFGLATTLLADAAPVRTTYLRFDVQGVSGATAATLRLFIESSSSTGVQIRAVGDTTWGETTLTHKNAPAVGGIVDSAPVEDGRWHEFDVSSLVSGPGVLSVAVTTPSSSSITMSSAEGAHPPELVIGAAPSMAVYAITREGAAYRARSTTGETFDGALKFVVESAVEELGESGGGTVSFAAGTFDLGNDYFEFDDIADITFAGQGRDATVIQNSSSEDGDTEPFNFSGTDNVTVRDLTVSAGGPFRSTSDALDFDDGNQSAVERVRVTAARGRGIVFDGKNAGWTSGGNVIRDCVITSGVPSDGIELLASSGNVVERCTITGVGGHGIQMAKSAIGADQPNVSSSDNVIRGNVVDRAHQDGINLNAGDRNRIAGNRVTNSGRDGIRVGTADGVACDDNVVQGNTASDDQATKTQRYGLAIASALCNRTVVGPNTLDGNRVGPILDQGTGTRYVTGDTQAPSAPTGVAASALSDSLVRVTWNASTDDVGVAEYRIYRDGSGTPLATVAGATLTYDDATVVPGTTYTYRVDAVDAFENASALSSPAASVTAPAAPPGPPGPPGPPAPPAPGDGPTPTVPLAPPAGAPDGGASHGTPGPGAPARPVTGASRPLAARLLAHRLAVRGNGRLVVRYVARTRGRVTLTVVRGQRRVLAASGLARPGRNVIVVRAPRLAGTYRLVLVVRPGTGTPAVDRGLLTVWRLPRVALHR